MKRFVPVALAAILMAEVAVGGIEPPAAPICGDVNDSGSINTTDALQVLRKSVGLNETLPCAGYEGAISACNTSVETCQEEVVEFGIALSVCNADRVECEADLSGTAAELATCYGDLGLCDEITTELQLSVPTLLRFQSTVTAAFDNGGGVPDGVAEGDTVSFTVTFNPLVFSAAEPVGVMCSPEVTDCSGAVWIAPAALPYVLTYSSGHIRTGEFDRIVLEDGGTSDPEGKPFPVHDRIVFLLGDLAVWSAEDFDGQWRTGAFPDSVDDALADIGQAGLFETSFYDGSQGGWNTYHYDYTTPQGATIVTKAP
jgi:hypothetical protein